MVLEDWEAVGLDSLGDTGDGVCPIDRVSGVADRMMT